MGKLLRHVMLLVPVLILCSVTLTTNQAAAAHDDGFMPAGVASTSSFASAAATDYPTSSYGISEPGYGSVAGNFIWYNRSVQVGGTLKSSGGCVAVVYTAYDGNDNVVARAARPGDNQYMCSGSRGHGFTLDASDVYGGIRYIRVTLWCRNSSGTTRNCAEKIFPRP